MNQLTQARYLQAYINANRAEDSKAIEEVGALLPFPATWMKSAHQSSLSISRRGAREFLSTYKNFQNSEILMIFDDILLDIQNISN